MGQTQGTSNDPEIIVIGGPNGAGKTTTAARILPYGLDVGSFVNADCIAAGISPHDPDDAAILAGREMLLRLRSLREARADFSFESTLASKGLARFLGEARAEGYRIRIGYVMLTGPELAVNRVRQRVSQGGHAIPEDVIHRRYWRSLLNFERRYAPLCDAWTLYSNAGLQIQPVASRRGPHPVNTYDSPNWRSFQRQTRLAAAELG